MINLSKQLLEAITFLNQQALYLIVHNNPQAIKNMETILASTSFEDNLKLSAASCINLAFRYLLSEHHDVHILMNLLKGVLTNPSIEQTHKWVLVKSVKLLIQTACLNISLQSSYQRQFWGQLCNECFSITNQHIHTVSLIVLDAIVESSIYESSFIYFLNKILSNVIANCLARFQILNLKGLKNLGNILNQIVKRLQRSDENHKSVIAKEMMIKIIQNNNIYNLFNRVYFIGVKHNHLIDLSSDCQRINLIKQTFAECHYLIIEEHFKLFQTNDKTIISKTISPILPFIIQSLKQSTKPKFMKNYSCQMFIIYVLRILKYIEISQYFKELINDVLFLFLRTSEEDFEIIRNQANAYVEEEDDLCSYNKYQTIKAASASLLQKVVDNDPQLFTYIYEVCESSIYGKQHSLIERGDAIQILTILSYFVVNNQTRIFTESLQKLFYNLQLFKSFNLFQKARWYNLVSHFCQQISMLFLKTYFCLANLSSQSDYYNLRCLDFIYNCSNKIVSSMWVGQNSCPPQQQKQDQLYTEEQQKANIDEQTPGSINQVKDHQLISIILNNLLDHVMTNKLQLFWTTLDEIIFLNQHIYGQQTYIKIVTSLYQRVMLDMKSQSQRDTQAIFNCLHIVKRIVALGQHYPLMNQIISQIFTLLYNPEQINFQQEIIAILNIFLSQSADITPYLQYLQPLHTVFKHNGQIYQSIFTTINLFIIKFPNTQINQYITIIYKFCIEGFSPSSDKWFEEDIGDALLLLQMFIYRFRSLLMINSSIIIQFIDIIKATQPKTTIPQTYHRIVNTYVLLVPFLSSNKSFIQFVIQQTLKCYQEMTEYNIRVLLVGLSNMLLEIQQEKVQIFQLVLKVLSLLLDRSITSVTKSKQDKHVDKNRNKQNEYYSQNVQKVKFMWKNGFKPFDHVRGILGIIQEQNKQALVNLVNSLSIQTQLKLKQMHPLLWMGNTFRKIISVNKIKQKPDPFSMKAINSQLRRLDEDQQQLYASHKKQKLQ